jgi:hypothetical protein
MEYATLAFRGATGVVSLWQTCVQVFDTISSIKRYGKDYEVAHVKLEVERVRLFLWGENVGLSIIDRGDADLRLGGGINIDPRLNRPEIGRPVMKLLGCIQEVFTDTDALQKKYGLKKAAAHDTSDSPFSETIEQSPRNSSSEEGSFVLGSVFKRAYASLQKSVKENSQSTSFRRKTVWAINDKAKFLLLVAEIKGFNDSLAAIFPDIQSRAADRLRDDIETSEDIRSLQLLQEASAQDHVEISDTASVRLENLGATILDEEAAETGSNDAEPTDAKVDELTEMMKKTEVFANDKYRGALTCSVSMAPWLSYCSAQVYWQDDTKDFSSWNDRTKGFVQAPHSALGTSASKYAFFIKVTP